MQIIHLNAETVDAGREALRIYSAGLAAGPGTHFYAYAMARETGLHLVVGALAECIEEGWRYEEDIVAAVMRVTRCRYATVKAVLDQFTGEEAGRHLWRRVDDGYTVLEREAYPPVLLAA